MWVGVAFQAVPLSLRVRVRPQPTCCLPSIDLDASDVVVRREMRVLLHGVRGEVNVSLLDNDAKTTLAHVCGCRASGSVELILPVDPSVSEDVECILGATSTDGGEAAFVKVITEAKMRLLMTLKRQLLFSGYHWSSRAGMGEEESFESGAPEVGQIDRVLALVETSLLQKLRTRSESHEGDGLDSASASFASMLRRLRTAARFASTPWHDVSEARWAAELETCAPVIRDELDAMLAQYRVVAQGSLPAEIGECRNDNLQWDSADYQAIAPAWRVMHLWKGGSWLRQVALG